MYLVPFSVWKTEHKCVQWTPMFSFSYRNHWHQQHFFCIKPPINFSYPDYMKEEVVPQQLYPSIPPSFSVLSFPSSATWDWLLPVKARVTADFWNTAPDPFSDQQHLLQRQQRKKRFLAEAPGTREMQGGNKTLFPCVGALSHSLHVSSQLWDDIKNMFCLSAFISLCMIMEVIRQQKKRQPNKNHQLSY